MLLITSEYGWFSTVYSKFTYSYKHNDYPPFFSLYDLFSSSCPKFIFHSLPFLCYCYSVPSRVDEFSFSELVKILKVVSSDLESKEVGLREDHGSGSNQGWM